MKEQNAKPGQIWQLRDSDAAGLIVCIWDEPTGDEEDLRIVPVMVGSSFEPIATHLDVKIPASENSLNDGVIAFCWNARTLSSQDLMELVGEVSQTALEVVRDVEMVGIDRALEAAHVEWRGPQVQNADADLRVTAQAELLEEWDDLHDRLAQYRRAVRQVIARSATRPGRLFEGSGTVATKEPLRSMLDTDALSFFGVGDDERLVA